MKVVIAPMCYKRPEVFEVFAQGVRNIAEYFSELEFIVICVTSVGEKPNKQQVESHGFTYYETENRPLTKKAQWRMDKLKEIDFDYWLSISDDDFITPAYFGFILNSMNEGYEYIAPMDLYYIRNSKLYYSNPYPLGHKRNGEPLAVGKAVSRGLLERVNYNLWNGSKKDRGLDKDAYNVLIKNSRKSHFFTCKNIGGMVVDVKSKTNLTAWDQKHQLVTEDIELLLPYNIVEKINKIPKT